MICTLDLQHLAEQHILASILSAEGGVSDSLVMTRLSYYSYKYFTVSLTIRVWWRSARLCEMKNQGSVVNKPSVSAPSTNVHNTADSTYNYTIIIPYNNIYI